MLSLIILDRVPVKRAMFWKNKIGYMEVSTFAFQLPSGVLMESGFLFDFLFHTGWVKISNPGTPMKRSDVRLELMLAFSIIVLKCQYLGYMALDYLLEKLSLGLDICQHSHAGFTSFAGDFHHGLDYQFLQNTSDTKNASIGNPVSTGYLLIEYIEESQGVMLSNSWMNGCCNKTLWENLFRDLSRIMLSMSRIPLPRIGSFVINENGFLRLINRPLSIELHQLENENNPTNIARDYTYSTVDSYIVDLLGVHDNRFRDQPNAVNDLGDCVFQLSTLSGTRTISPTFERSFRRGPFIFSLTDIHQSNIFVDADWHITYLVDLEWACSRPIEMISTPYWLTNKGVDQLIQEEYDAIRSEYMNILAVEEKKIRGSSLTNHSLPALSEVMNRAWATGTFWYTLALCSPSGVFTIFTEHIRPLFCKDYTEEFHLIMPFLWGKNVGYIAGCKLSDKEQYDKELRQTFEDNSS
ncbi:predicted protein [Paecilomyces variotii No. 5]|uniref:Aminoglycoside phosphotransferase domain-containing protein n=1 Tax=Byssochlamys spectabilis (strain No. 5 / NBRC 109023) TaxID=1356009 RepID=V5G391_BYSSN|nr:predicted protein [Paecilomyces variotii No. 5]